MRRTWTNNWVFFFLVCCLCFCCLGVCLGDTTVVCSCTLFGLCGIFFWEAQHQPILLWARCGGVCVEMKEKKLVQLFLLERKEVLILQRKRQMMKILDNEECECVFSLLGMDLGYCAQLNDSKRVKGVWQWEDDELNGW